MGTYNKLRSKAHKKYNQTKKDYQYLEKKIVDYKQRCFEKGKEVNPDTLKRMRNHLKIVVNALKVLKGQMTKYNREWNEDEELMRECCRMRYSQRRINERYREKYGFKKDM